MKNFILYVVLVLIPILGIGQDKKIPVQGTVDLSGYYNKTETEALMDAKIKAALGNPNVPPVVSLPDCPEGPILGNISNQTATSLSFQFHGVEVHEIDWKITKTLADTNAIRRGRISNINGNTPGIIYDLLPPGKYWLTINGGNCKEKIKAVPKTFSILSQTDGGGGGVIVVPEPEPGAAAVSMYIAKGMDDHLNLEITGSSGNWILNDKSNPYLEPDYEFRYLINGQIVLTSSALSGYKYQSNNPLRVIKFKTKVGLQTLNMWGETDTYYYSTKAGLTFSYNTTAGMYTGVFIGDLNTGIPPNFDPRKQTSQWADITSFELPKGHIFIAPKSEWTIDNQLSKGVTHISHFSLPWENYPEVERMRKAGLTYSDVQRPENFLGLDISGPDDWSNGYNSRYWKNGPLNEQQAIEASNRIMCHIVTINETEEGNSFIDKNNEMWRNIYKPYRARQIEEFDKKGLKSYLCHNYFTLGLPSLANMNRETAKLFGADPNREGNFNPWKNGSLQDNNLICISIYLNAPDLEIGIMYKNIFQMLNNTRIGQHSAIFLAGVHEWRPNNPHRILYPDGTYYQYEKIPLDPNVIIQNAFISNVFGIGMVEWGGQGKFSGRKLDTVNRGGLWFPTGATTPQGGFPYAAINEPAYTPYMASVDLCAFGTKLYSDTFGKVYNGTSQYLAYRLDGGNWIYPSQEYANEVIDAYYDQRGMAYAQTKDGKTAWFYINPYADNLSHKLELILPNGNILTKTVSSNGVHAGLI